MKIVLQLFFGALMIIVLFGCGNGSDVLDDIADVDENDPEEIFVTAKVNGVEFSAQGETFVNTSSANNSGFFSLAIGAVDVEQGRAKAIALAIVAIDREEVQVDDTFTETDDNGFGATAAYEEGVISEEAEIEADKTQAIAVKITAVDQENQTISGEFSFTAIDEDTNTTITVTDGVFNKVPLD
ncbi:MAG: DUF6252 family protein [Cyclobacteriaceae bacterium]